MIGPLLLNEHLVGKYLSLAASRIRRMQTARRIAGWVGTALFAIALAFFQDYLTRRISSSVTVTVISLSVAALCALFWFATRNSSANEMLATAPNVTTNTNTVSPVFNINSGIGLGEQNPVKPAPNVIPILKLARYQVVREVSDRYADSPDHREHRLFVIPVQNVPPEQDVQFETAWAISASLAFQGEHDIEGRIARAFWYNETFNQVDVHVEREAKLVIGEIINGEWVCCENACERALSYEEMLCEQGLENDRHEIRIPFVEGQPINVRITIFSNRLRKVLLKEQYQIWPLADDQAHMERLIIKP